VSLEARPRAAVAVPLDYPCSTIFVDESGSPASGGSFFVIAAVKVRNVGRLMREVKHIRDRQDYFGELKFATVSKAKLPIFMDVIDALSASDAHISATVVDLQAADDPFAGDEPRWVGTARLTARLLHGSIVRRELATALIDQVSTPPDAAFDETVRHMTNRRLRATSLVSALCADSRCCDGLQLADLVAGAIAYQRRSSSHSGNYLNPTNHRGKVAARLASNFGVADFRTDRRTDRVNVMTFGNVAPPARAYVNLTSLRRRS
jgi:hypothetical protein